MTKEGFAELQQRQAQSGMSLKTYLRHIGTSYSTYNYWRKKYRQQEVPHHALAPITFRQEAPDAPSLTGQPHGGVPLLFPNGLRAHFGSGTEALLMELLDKSLSGHVLP